MVGEPVRFLVHAVDPDAKPIKHRCGYPPSFGDAEPTACGVLASCDTNAGPWTPTSRQRGELTQSFDHTYATAGTYKVEYALMSAQGSSTDPACAGDGISPYADNGYATVTVTVRTAPA